MTSAELDVQESNGAALAAFLAAAVGSFAMGLFVILNEMGVMAAPALYGPSGGVSGRTTLAGIVWLATWGVLHWRWRSRFIKPGPVWTGSLILIGLGLLLTFPPLWVLFEF